MDSYLLNTLHYNSYPVFNTLTEDPRNIDSAQIKYGSAYLYEPRTQIEERFAPLFKLGKPAVPISSGETKALWNKLLESRNDDQKYGEAVRYLKHGRPFSAPFLFAHNWDKVWDDSQTFDVPASKDSENWIPIRDALRKNRRVVLRDRARGTKAAFRLTFRGDVEFKVVELAQAIHKRDLASSHDDSLEQALWKNQNALKQLRKRGMSFSDDTSSFGARSRTLEFVLSYPQGFRIMSDLQRTPGGEAGLSRKWAHVLHFQGHPVFDVDTTEEGDLEQALVDYDYAYVYGYKQGKTTRSVIQLFRNRGPVEPAPNSRQLLQIIKQSSRFEHLWGPQIRALTDGRPIQRIQPASRDSNVFFRGRGHAPLDLYAMRETLARTHSLQINDVDTHNLIEMTLNTRGLANLASDTEPRLLPSHLVKRISGDLQRSESFGLDKKLVRASNRLAKRMNPNPLRDPTKIEYYTRGTFGLNSNLAPNTLEETINLFAGVLHYHGKPIFFPATDSNVLEKARRAPGSYSGFYFVGTLVDDPQQGTVAYHMNREGGISTAEDGVLQKIREMNLFAVNHGILTRDLMYGPSFPRPSSSGFFGRHFRRYKTPSWNKVMRKAERVPIDTHISTMWNKLHQKNMLVVMDGNTQTGYALDENGQLLHQDLSHYMRSSAGS